MEIASNNASLTEFNRTFSGTIDENRRIPVESFLDELSETGRAGIFSFKVHFPQKPPLSGLPLLGCGVQGDGNLIFAKTDGGESYRVALDDWGYGELIGKPFIPTPGEHTLQVVLGPLLVGRELSKAYEDIANISILSSRIYVRLDGKMLGVFKLVHHLRQFGKLTPAANPQGFSTAAPSFDGVFDPFPMTDAEVRELLADALHESIP
jgi:hypothetical protein